MNEQLTYALNSRVVIEQAKGMVAERLGLDMEQAFNRLRNHARSHNLRLGDVARSVIDGTLAAELAGAGTAPEDQVARPTRAGGASTRSRPAIDPLAAAAALGGRGGSPAPRPPRAHAATSSSSVVSTPSASSTAPIVSANPTSAVASARRAGSLSMPCVRSRSSLRMSGADPHDVLQPGVTRARVVDGNAHSGRAEIGQRRHQRRVVVDARVLGELQDDAFA